LDLGKDDLQRNFPAVRSAGEPLETSAAAGHAIFNLSAGHPHGALSVWLEGWRHLKWVFTQHLVRELPAHNPNCGRIDLQYLVLVMENHPMARAFKQRAVLRFRFAQGALRTFAFGVVDDAGANQVLTFCRQAQQPNFGRNQPAVGLLMDPLEYRHFARQGCIHQFAGEFAGTSPARLKFGADGLRE
jgi:hypothetical protein